MRRALIEEELPLAAANEHSRIDKYLSRGHISALHRYWARRPLAMARAIVFGSLADAPESGMERQVLLDLLADALSFEAASKEAAIKPLASTIRPGARVLDCFAGGGAIPLEALRLGCETHALDINPVAHLVQLCCLDFPLRYRKQEPDGSFRLTRLFRRAARRVGERTMARVADAYDIGASPRPTTYYWARTARCADPSCGIEIPLLSGPVPPRSSGYWIETIASRRQVDLRVRQGVAPQSATGTVRSASVVCPRCENTIKNAELKRIARDVGFGSRLYAVGVPAGRSKLLREPTTDEAQVAINASTLLPPEDEIFPDGTTLVPDESCDPDGYRRVQNIPWSLLRWRDLFLPRQLLLLVELCREVRNEYDLLIAEGCHPDEASAIIAYLAMCVDRIADWNSSVCGEKNTFPRQAIRLIWDHVEIDPFTKVGGNWAGAVELVASVIDHCSLIKNGPATVKRGDVQALPYDSGYFDAVIIDPPYYDSIQYSYLSDFFYVWMKRAAGAQFPELLATSVIPKSRDVVQNQAHKTSPALVTREEFEARLDLSFAEIARVVRDDGIVTVVFAHTDVKAWEYLLSSLRRAGLVVTTSWPMRSESPSRSTAQQSAVLGSSVVLACRKHLGTGEGFYDDVVRNLEVRIAERLATFEEMHLIGADYFVSAIGPAFEVFARYSRVVRLSGTEVGVDELMVLARQAVARHAIRRLLGGENLDALDGRSLLYLTWRWAYDGEAIPADEAYKLGRAFEIDIAELARPGDLIAKTGDSFRLLAPHERKDPKLSTTPSLIDVLHLAAQFHDAGRRNELAALLGATGMGGEPGFWATATAIAESLPDGNRERTMLLGLTGNKDQLALAAARHVGTSVEELTLFGNS